MPFDGEVLRFELAGQRSTVTRQMVQIRVRMTAQAFGVGSTLVGANLTGDGSALEVDAAALLGANAAVRSRLETGPEAAVRLLRSLSTARAILDRRASAFATTVARGQHPGRDRVVKYVEAAARYQALGALKFCIPERLRSRLVNGLRESSLVDALLAPDGPTLWSIVRRRELALAGARLRLSEAAYRRRLEEHRRGYGYLLGEDVDFQSSEGLAAIDARVTELASRRLTDERRRLDTALASDRAVKGQARQAFAEWLASEPDEDSATLVSQVLLARALVAHEDQNRQAKMRFLRDMRDLADLLGIDLERADVAEFAVGERERVGAR